MGAATLFTVTASDANVVAQGPKAVVLSTRPWTLGANPGAVTGTRLHGERAPIRDPPPALRKLPEDRIGPGGMILRVKGWVMEMSPMNALMVTVPGVAPAVTVICARPSGPVVDRKSTRLNSSHANIS